MSSRFRIALVLAVLPLTAAAGQSPKAPPAGKNGPQMPAELEAPVKGYLKAEAAAKEKLLKDIDKAIDHIRLLKLDPSVREKHMNEVKEAREQFEKNGVLPTHNDLILKTIRYLNTLGTARAEFNNKYLAATKEARRTKDDDKHTQLVKAKAAFDEKAAGREQFGSDTRWSGTRHNGKRNVDVNLNIGKVTGNSFTGTYVQNPGSANRFVMEFEGLLNGNVIEVITTSVKKEDTRVLKFTGYVIGDRIILDVDGIAAGGGPASGLIDLRKR